MGGEQTLTYMGISVAAEQLFSWGAEAIHMYVCVCVYVCMYVCICICPCASIYTASDPVTDVLIHNSKRRYRSSTMQL